MLLTATASEPDQRKVAWRVNAESFIKALSPTLPTEL